MGAIRNFLERMGFVKLDRYGLLLTPEGRIISSRPAVLDDGLGGRIVGWLDGDLPAMELDAWEPVRPAPTSRGAVAFAPTVPAPARPPMPAAAKVVAPAAKLPGVTPVAPPPAPVAPPPAPVVFAPPAVVAAPAPVAAVAPAEEPEDDDWEWTIVMARARAAAEESEQAAAAPKFVAPAPKTEPMAKVCAPAVKPAPKFIPAKTEPMAAQREQPEDWDALIASAHTPRTIIPVPQLPRVSDPSQVRPQVTPLRRIPRATGRIEDTVRTQAAPANDDRTSPGIALPPAGGGRRVAAKHR